MTDLVHAIATAPRRGDGQDRSLVLPCEHGIVIAVADGAGGTAGGEVAAQAVIDRVTGAPHAADWAMLLTEVDLAQIGFGQTAAVVLWVTHDKIVGASAGDSGAWIVRGDRIEDVTIAQHRKPLIGDGAIVSALATGPLAGGTLLVATDGLLRYAKREDIVRLANGPDLDAAARAMVELVRLPSGQLPDDVTVVLCRER